MITLDDEQVEAVYRIVTEPTRAALCAAQYGVGKTVIAVEAAYALGGAVNLIICPVFTRFSWKRTILTQHPDVTVKIIGSNKEGKQALQDLLAGEPGWYIIGRELFRSKQPLINPMSHKIDFACYDECQAWSNHRSAGFKMMKKFNPGYKLAMSATPARNRFQGMFAIHQWLWPKMEGHQSFWKWVDDWCTTEQDHFAGVVIKGEKNPGEFVEKLPCYIMIERDFGDPLDYEIELELSLKERKIYDQIEKMMIAWLDENPLVIKFPHTKRLRLRQVTLGEIAYDKDTDEVYFPDDMKSTKLEALFEIIAGSDEPMLVFTQSQRYAKVVVARMQAKGLRAVEWSGAVSAVERENIKERFMNGELDYIVATPASIGEGTDGLQHRCRIMVWMDRSDDGMVNEQAYRRLYRRGQEHQVVSITLVAKDTYDRGQLSNLLAQKIEMNKSLKREGKV